MVDTIKFSEMTNAGNINNNDIVPSLRSSENVILNNPWVFLPSGTTAQRPAPSATINYRLRLNTDTQVYEYYNPILGTWIVLAQISTIPGPFLTYTADVSLPGAQNLGALSNGILKQTITTGIATLDIALQGTDYYGPGDTPTFAGMSLTGNLDMGGFTAINAAEPLNPQDYATKFYVDQNSLTGTSVYAASAATLGTVTQSGSGVGATITNAGVQAVFALDGVNPPVGTNVLIKDTATGMTSANEGIYTVLDVGSISTNWQIRRATSYDTVTEINNTGLINVKNGSTLAGTAWYNIATIVTVDATPFNYAEFGNIVFPITLPHGGTNANLTAAAGGVVFSTSTALAISAVGTSGQLFQSSGISAPGWTTTIYPVTNAINTIMYASSANVLGVITPVNNAVLVSSAGGVPSMSTTLPANLALTTPLISGSIKDANGNIIIGFNPASSAVNYFQFQNAAAGNLPSLSLIGSDTNITGNLFSKGTGGFNIYGCSNASNSPAGAVGEIISSTVLAASPVSLTSTVNVDITSISLTAGDWDVYGNISYNPPGVASACFGWANTSSATTPDLALTNNVVTGVVVNRWGFNIPFLRVNASGAQTVYLTAAATFASGSAAAYGSIFARRRR